MKKIIVILGPTASGKSALAVALSKKFGGEVVSADSRQVYKGLDIGTGKITKKEMKSVPHHLLDVVSPIHRLRSGKEKQFSVTEYKKMADQAIAEIVNRGKLPIVCGGTGFYISVLLGEMDIPEVIPNIKLRKKLEFKKAVELFEILKKLDPERAKNIDKNNSRRLIRAIEIAKALGKVPKNKPKNVEYEALKIGITFKELELKKRINKRIDEWFKQGLIEEVERLHKNGLSWKRMGEIGLEYKLISEYLMSRIPLDIVTLKNLKKKMSEKTWQYAKRQMTWFKRDKEIVWFNPTLVNGFSTLFIKNIEKEVKKFVYFKH